MVQLLERFYDPISYSENTKKEGDENFVEVVADDERPKNQDGVVRIDDKDLRGEDIRWLRKNMGYVGQEPVLFNDTIYNNIALGKPNCTDEEVFKAAKNSNAFDFIVGLPDRFDTVVGVGGGKISGGQKQRVAIARGEYFLMLVVAKGQIARQMNSPMTLFLFFPFPALLSNPKILILDEATSALDNESEKIVQASLDRLVKESGGERTTIIIAHRLSTIRNADCICVLENHGSGSRVVEAGTHSELLELGKKYKSLVEAYESN